MRKLAPALAAALLLVGCTASEKLKDYPERRIDRPYTLPAGIATWQTFFGYMTEKDDTGWDWKGSILYPFLWSQALSDTWQLTWMPLPLIVSHEISRDEAGYWGATLGSGFGYSEWRGVVLLPAFQLVRRQKLSPDFAIDGSVFANFVAPTRNGDFEWIGGLGVHPIFQLSSRFALGPSLSWVLEDETVTSFDLSRDDPFQTSTSRKSRFPIGFRADWLLSKQWELSFSATYRALGYDWGYRATETLLTTTHFW